MRVAARNGKNQKFAAQDAHEVTGVKKADPLVLEPVMKVEISAPLEFQVREHIRRESVCG